MGFVNVKRHVTFIESKERKIKIDFDVLFEKMRTIKILLKSFTIYISSRRFCFRYFFQQARDFFLLVESFPQFEKINYRSSDFLNLVHVDVELGKPMFELLLENNTGDLKGADSNLLTI